MKGKLKKIFNIQKDIPTPKALFVELDEKNIYCSICKIILQARSKMRHYKEKHLNITQICYICGKYVKRLTPHLDIHKKRKEIEIDTFQLSNKQDVFDLFPNNKSSFNKTETLSFSSINQKLLKIYKDDISPFYKDIFVFKSFEIGFGSHGVVNFGLSAKVNESLAVKTYEFNFSKYHSKEINALSKLEKYDLFPKIISKGDPKNNDYIAETLIGIDVYRLFEFQNKYFDTVTILNIARDVIYCLSYLNKENIIHCDLKCDNFVWNCFGRNNDCSRIILIDYSCSILKSQNNKIKKIGSNSYSSLNQTLENIPNTSDEIESLIYTLLELSNMNLPWLDKKFKDKNKNKKMLIYEKEKFIIEEYLPQDLKILGLIFNDVKRKRYDSDIDFKFYDDLLIDQINKVKSKLNVDYKFIWENKIKEILLHLKTEKDKSNFDKLIFNGLFSGIPKEYVIYNLNKFFNI